MADPSGLFVFTCKACKESFPARCEEHFVVRERIEKEPQGRPPALRLELQLKQRTPAVLPYGEPIPEYDAPYQVLEREIRDALRATR